jgi:putative heme-binding domain-containing protein
VRGREVFRNEEKSLCTKCHRVGNHGGRIGPDLSGIGRRFSRIHVIESILEPSRTITPSYATLAIARKDGRVVTGVRIAETERSIVLGDNTGGTHEILKVDIEEALQQQQSTMPDGLEKRLTEAEFVDLIAYLMTDPQ